MSRWRSAQGAKYRFGHNFYENSEQKWCELLTREEREVIVVKLVFNCILNDVFQLKKLNNLDMFRLDVWFSCLYWCSHLPFEPWLGFVKPRYQYVSFSCMCPTNDNHLWCPSWHLVRLLTHSFLPLHLPDLPSVALENNESLGCNKSTKLCRDWKSERCHLFAFPMI